MTSRIGHTMAIVAAVLALVAVACGSDTEGVNADAAGSGFEVVTEAVLTPGDEIPAPSDDVVLTITGAIAVTNVEDSLQLDMSTLESIGLVSYEVDDDQAEGRRVAFTGVLLRDLLAVAGADPDAVALEMTALNDYAVSVPAADAEASPVMIATQSDGERMPVANYGPVRVVYPYDSHDLDSTLHDPRWIWQLSTIDVR